MVVAWKQVEGVMKWETKAASRAIGHDESGRRIVFFDTRPIGAETWLPCRIKETWGKHYYSLNGGFSWHKSRTEAATADGMLSLTP